ncbi:alpha/beta hydrolase [Streptomyces sp. NPDC102462]|uniref:alpha/beta hydrolase n=1 Tax=Streptomyces sp. NPDC102462 TaxID=3366178 RepID=UPI0037F4238A
MDSTSPQTADPQTADPQAAAPAGTSPDGEQKPDLMKAFAAAMAATDSVDSVLRDDEIRLWPAAAPGSEGWTHQEKAFKDPAGGHRIRNVVVPTLTAYLPDPEVATGAAVIVAPGGGFIMLSMDSEGSDVAEWLQTRGVAAFVLKYRLADSGPTQPDFVRHFLSAFAPLQGGDTTPGRTIADVTQGVPALALADLIRAIGVVRERAAEWSVDPGKVGLVGFSAGGYLSARAALAEQDAHRPDFVACVYGGLVDSTVPRETPPLFTVVTADDPLCFDDTMQMIGAWKRAGRPVEAHIYPDGGHGFGLNKTGRAVDAWPERLRDWLGGLGHLTAPESH